MDERITPTPGSISIQGAAPLSAISLATTHEESVSGIHEHELRSTIRQRWTMLVVIGLVFVLLNGAVLYLIWQAGAADTVFATAHPDLPDRRAINSAVFMSLIAATVAQTGAVTWAMARFLFPGPLGDDSE